MSNTLRSIHQLIEDDPRFKFDAYVFIFEALRYGHDILGMGTVFPSTKSTRGKKKKSSAKPAGDEAPSEEKHLTGQELCEACRQLALEQYGYMAKTVLNSWGVQTTDDWGEIVFNLIRIGEFSKTEHDRREDFANVYPFDVALVEQFQIKMTPDERNG